MVELIFALVIMGIVLMSAPTLIRQSVNSGNIAIQQEAIAAISSQTAIVLSMHWDENNTDIPIGESPVLFTNKSFSFPPKGLSGGVSGRNTQDGNNTLNANPHNNFGANIDTNESNYTKFDDIDDYDNSSFGLYLFSGEETSADIGDYIDIDINMTTTINYADDNVSVLGQNITDANIRDINNTPVTGFTTNIKFITVNLTTNNKDVKELEKNITLRAFSCNIGTFSIEGKMKP